ncbi:hypothetical protein BCON_0024g00060 [Botryotinia convoluta]|uniref:Uncharacterized protein n=1 Tax=Botryotinia convoluta TaxID=54673 RepID=A0A4Z1IK80_9HELO|nr:hypothetical protein BCON_0024g00060 [Botryotinia convoluta]
MQPPYPCPTATWRNDVYPAIDATQPILNQNGRTIVITGAGSGIGRETALTFAKAGAKHLVLIGRNEANLLESQKRIPTNSATSSIFATSVSDEDGIKKVADTVGTWDVLIMGAAHEGIKGPIVSTNISTWWESYETSVKSIVYIVQAFLPNANRAGAYVYAITSGAIALPVSWLGVHPGMVDTKTFRGAGVDPATLPMDNIALPANFLVWLSQPKSKFLNGRLIWANWDVDELSAQAERIQNSSYFTIGCIGWPYVPAG